VESVTSIVLYQTSDSAGRPHVGGFDVHRFSDGPKAVADLQREVWNTVRWEDVAVAVRGDAARARQDTGGEASA